MFFNSEKYYMYSNDDRQGECSVCNMSFSERLILADIIGIETQELFVNNIELNLEQEKDFDRKKLLLSEGYPVDYLLSRVRIGSLSLSIDKGVFIPRPETEQIFNMDLAISDDTLIVDMCSGSGAIGLNIAKKFGNNTIVCVDVDQKAIDNIEKNTQSNYLENVEVVKSNLFENESLVERIKSCSDWVLICNPPYVPESDKPKKVENNLEFEPDLAIYSPENGLYLFNSIVESIKILGHLPSKVIFELDPRNIDEAAVALRETYKHIDIIKDSNDLDRFLVALDKIQ